MKDIRGKKACQEKGSPDFAIWGSGVEDSRCKMIIDGGYWEVDKLILYQ